jgi:hypothetical protein
MTRNKGVNQLKKINFTLWEISGLRLREEDGTYISLSERKRNGEKKLPKKDKENDEEGRRGDAQQLYSYTTNTPSLE